jgi:hypothetical protein
LAPATPGYTAQSFSQDDWMSIEQRLSGRDAVDAFLATSKMNVELFAGLSQPMRDTTFTHPEYGEISVDWIIHQMAGHHIHHIRQLEQIQSAPV